MTQHTVAVEVEYLEKRCSVGDELGALQFAVAVFVGRFEPIDDGVGRSGRCAERLAARTDEYIRQAVLVVIVRRGAVRHACQTHECEKRPTRSSSGNLHHLSHRWQSSGTACLPRVRVPTWSPITALRDRKSGRGRAPLPGCLLRVTSLANDLSKRSCDAEFGLPGRSDLHLPPAPCLWFPARSGLALRCGLAQAHDRAGGMTFCKGFAPTIRRYAAWPPPASRSRWPRWRPSVPNAAFRCGYWD